MPRRKDRICILLTLFVVYAFVQTFLNLKWIVSDSIISDHRSNINMNSLFVPSKTISISADRKVSQLASAQHNLTVLGIKGTRLVKGKFVPSFSLRSDNVVSVTTLDRYNEFEYADFKIPVPNFPRSIDKELFYKMGVGTELLKWTPYIRRRGVVEIIPGGSYSNPLLCGWPSNYTAMYTNYVSAHHYDQLCPLMTPEGNSFQHFFDGLLPKLVQVRDILLNPDVKVLIPTPRESDKNMIMNILDRIGIKLSQIVWSSANQYSADYMIASCITPPLHPRLWKTARNLMGVQDQPKVSQDKSYVILLTRALSHNRGRRVLNQEEVTKYLRNRYGRERVVVFKGGYSFNESVELFGKCHLMIGVHGGAFYNLNFAPKSIKLLEIMPYMNNRYPQGLATTIFWSMAGLIGQEYWRLFIRTTGQNNVILDTKLLEETLEKIDKQTNRSNILPQ